MDVTFESPCAYWINWDDDDDDAKEKRTNSKVSDIDHNYFVWYTQQYEIKKQNRL